MQRPILVGEASGVDRAVQQYLHEQHYSHVTVFCSGHRPRCNVHGWPVHALQSHVPESQGFRFYRLKDQEMARQAYCGLMIWDGKTVGTLLNIMRLVKQEKACLVYHQKKWVQLKNSDHWQSWSSCIRPELLNELRIKAEDWEWISYYSKSQPKLA